MMPPQAVWISFRTVQSAQMETALGHGTADLWPVPRRFYSAESNCFLEKGPELGCVILFKLQGCVG